MPDLVLAGANPVALLFLLYIIVQRLLELAIAKRNTARLLAAGAEEHGAAHYPVMVLMHTVWITGLVLFGYDEPVHLGWLAVFAVLQILRLWILASIGKRWTTRVIVVPNETLVSRGPFAFVRHPNYLLVGAEILVAPMVVGLWEWALLFTVLNAAMLWWRVGVEERALGLR